MRPFPAKSKWASKCLKSPLTQHAYVGAPDAKNLIIQPNTADRLHKHAHGAGGGVTGERGVVPLPLAQTARAHIALPGWGALSTELAF